jgi:uncharacterized protein YegP (UPF0339 family)
MIHICKSPKTKQFYIVVLAKNGEVLSTSELLKNKSSCYKNIRSQMKEFDNHEFCFYQDDTGSKPLVFAIDEDVKKVRHDIKPHPIYTPTKNKKK